MAIENCISDWDWDETLSAYRRRCRKRPRVSLELLANLAPISNLPGDVLDQILVRLPNPRFACRCKLVCKRWNSVICSPRFNRLFVSHHQTTVSLNHALMPEDPYELQSIILSFLPPMHRVVGAIFRVLDCNKDLVLCGFWDSHCQSVESSRAYLVCNPFTKQWIELPLAPRKSGLYAFPSSRLVCEPRISINLDLGQGQEFIYSEYRFRVVCIYQAIPEETIKLDVFCSESGEWTKDAFVSDRSAIIGARSVLSCNGELFWQYVEGHANNRAVAGFNPFRLDMPPTSIDVSAFHSKPCWFLSKSQGALHIIALENNRTLPVRSSIWRLEEDGKSWRKQCEGVVNKTATCCNYEAEGFYSPFLHPHKPELVFFSPFAGVQQNAIICCDLGREGLLHFFSKLKSEPDVHHLEVFQPRVSCWATPIPRYKELQAMHDGIRFLAESSGEAKTRRSIYLLKNCMNRVVKSAFYKDYIEHVTSEATLNMLVEIIQRRKNKIGEIVSGGTLVPRSPNFDNEWDALLDASFDLEHDIRSIVELKEDLKQALLHEMPELPYPPPGPNKSSFWREVSSAGLKSTVAVLLGGVRSLKREGQLAKLSQLYSRLA